ncbi:SRPBCC family protein [Modestobacter marinus]|uniref:SRPBCC family protein n=1 Tax=Modestobacter marinus TaxID=477641 RepID=UPI001C9594F0|nr:SRPBCC family protein [Modestobacter marinus]
MSTSTHETQILADPDVPLIRIIREFDAPPEKVFRAHTDPELVVQWQGPNGMEARIDHFDCRTGGSYRYVHTQDGEEYGFHGCFHEVRPNELIVQTFTFEGVPDGVALEKMVLEDLGNGRTKLTATSLVDSFADRDAFLASGMEVGVREGYERLDAILAG